MDEQDKMDWLVLGMRGRAWNGSLETSHQVDSEFQNVHMTYILKHITVEQLELIPKPRETADGLQHE